MDETAVPTSTTCGCEPRCGCATEAPATNELIVVWQRLVADGVTCPRCGTTQDTVRRAVERLAYALRPLGVSLVLEERALDQATFEGAPGESNRIWVGGRPLEEWVGASSGASRCCGACGDNDCRTIEVAGSTFEAVPEQLIVAAVLSAAASLLIGGAAA